ncbi:MAG: MFS transporter [Caldilineaceae bacterium]
MTNASQGDSPSEKHDPYAAFRIYEYRLYLIGWLLASIGTRIQSVAIGWEMYQRTGEALSLGLVGLAQALPTMLLALPAGYLADRFNRPKLVMVSLFAMTLTSAGLAVLSYNQGSITWMYILLALDATAVIIGRPARVALLPQLVPLNVLANAVTWNTSLMQITGVVGPALGGLIIATIDPSFAFVVTAATSLIFMFLLSRFRFGADVKRSAPPTLQTLLAGIHFVWNARIILTMISLDLFGVLLGGAVYLLPIYADDILHVGATGFGWLRAAPAIGAFCMAISMIYLPPMKRAGWRLLISVGAFGVATIIFGFAKSFGLAFAMLFLTGAFDNVSMVVRQTAQQLLTPDHMRGRVSAVTSVFVGASNELGGLESGVVAQYFGPVFSVVSGGIGTLIVVAITAWLSPELRRLGSLHNIKPVAVEPVQEKEIVTAPA